MAFKKTFSYAGFEMQPRSFTDPLILLLNIELELKAEKDNAEVQVPYIVGYRAVGPGSGPRAPSETFCIPLSQRVGIRMGIAEGAFTGN